MTPPHPPKSGIVDFHNHLLPGVDDGARRVEQSLESLRAMAAQGITTCIVTPHFDASLTRSNGMLAARLAQFDTAWETLTAAVAAAEDAAQLPTLGRGTEVMLDEPDPNLGDPAIRLAGGPFVLCEFPSLRLPPNAEWGIANLVRNGWRPIVAHPERYRNLDTELVLLARLREAGACFQLNAGSLLGDHGDAPERIARRLLAFGWVDYIASDHHARGVPATGAAVAMLRESGGAKQALRLTEENPARLLAGEPPLAVEPFAPPETSSWWSRILRRGKGS